MVIPSATNEDDGTVPPLRLDSKRRDGVAAAAAAAAKSELLLFSLLLLACTVTNVKENWVLLSTYVST